MTWSTVRSVVAEHFFSQNGLSRLSFALSLRHRQSEAVRPLTSTLVVVVEWALAVGAA